MGEPHRSAGTYAGWVLDSLMWPQYLAIALAYRGHLREAYQTDRRVECAKLLLARPAVSVTDVGLTMGFCDTSSFSAAFRKATGFSPTGYQRTLG